MSVVRALTTSAVIQALAGAGAALWLLVHFEDNGMDWTMSRGGGTQVVCVVFLGILAYRLAQQYLRK
jgi:hypothetical protein